MSLFNDVSQFLEAQLDDFLRQNPQLALQVLEDQLREQEAETRRLILKLQQQEEQLQGDILAIAEDIRLWHHRITKAEAAGRQDLVTPAREREAALLRQGNQRWGQLQSTQENRQQSEVLLQKTLTKRQELAKKIAAAKANQTQAPTPPPSGWHNAERYRRHPDSVDVVDSQFREWELEDELKQMRKDLGI
ncbi:MAG: TIGR04376 family protein [Spirulina sp. DLM2.Bin59]|nr:MAG: TIGR04376 family protein [Spirulina sp. DLM2.Bin59]